MTEFIEGVVSKIARWVDNKGADVELHDDFSMYYYNGEMNVIKNAACRFEIKQGEGIHQKKYEILNCVPLKSNPEVPKPPGPPKLPDNAAKSMVQIPYNQFMEVINSKSALKEIKTRSLDAATKVYNSMSKIEKDPKAAAQEVVVIATILEGYLV